MRTDGPDDGRISYSWTDNLRYKTPSWKKTHEIGLMSIDPSSGGTNLADGIAVIPKFVTKPSSKKLIVPKSQKAIAKQAYFTVEQVSEADRMTQYQEIVKFCRSNRGVKRTQEPIVAEAKKRPSQPSCPPPAHLLPSSTSSSSSAHNIPSSNSSSSLEPAATHLLGKCGAR